MNLHRFYPVLRLMARIRWSRFGRQAPAADNAHILRLARVPPRWDKADMSRLFQPLKIKDVEFKNRIFVSPMCQYSATDGIPNDWHLVHLGARATGGAALVIAEATGVSPEARISPSDTGIWNNEQTAAFARIVTFIRSQGAIAGIQLAHAGRKASNAEPWNGHKPLAIGDRGWETVGPSAVAFDEGWPAPREMSKDDMKKVVADFANATKRAERAGFEVVEIHMAHGYLLNEFLSPLSNKRTDEYGGSRENRMRFPLEVARAVRAAWPDRLPLFTRISAFEWMDGGWTLEDSVALAKELKAIGVDLIDCSSGGNHPHAKIEVKPGYQVPFAEGVKRGAQVMTGAVGLITEPKQAEDIIASGKADAVLIARELLRDPHWPLRAAHELGVKVKWPKQYDRAQWR